MVSILITLLIALVVLGIIFWIIRLLPIPPPWGNIILAIIALIFVIWLITQFVPLGGMGGHPIYHR